MNKKAIGAIGMVISLILGLFIIFFGYQMIFVYGSDKASSIIDTSDNVIQNIGEGININDPCPCSNEVKRVEVDGVFYCVAQANEEQCNKLGFDRTEDGTCYYTKEQCLAVRS